MKSVTIEQVLAWNPCGIKDDDDGFNYTPQRIERLFAGRDSLTASDIAELDIPREDVIWSLLHNEFLTDEQMHTLSCDFAEKVVHFCDDPRAQAAIDAKRSWLRGEITDNDLAAAWAAARAAAMDAAWAAARDAAMGAAMAAAWAAARDAARDAAMAAAMGAARAAAMDAAWAAAMGAQIERILAEVERCDKPQPTL